MKTHFSIFLLISVFLGNSCATDPPPTAEDRALRQSLDSLEGQYNTLEFPQALAHARALNAKLNQSTYTVDEALRAEVYQYLAMLHFDHQVFTDSIQFYVDRAAALIQPVSSNLLRARQLLCQAYNGFEDFAWMDMQLFSRLGRELLERSKEDHSVLYGLLLLIEGRAAKQHARPMQEGEVQGQFWTLSDERISLACEVLSDLGSPWEYFAREHHILLLINHPQNDPLIPALIDRLATEVNSSNTPARSLHVRERLLGYWHNARKRSTSATHYYRALLSFDSIGVGKRVGEAHYLLKQYSLSRLDYPMALDLTIRNMVQQSCCPPEVNPTAPDAVLYCKQRVDCVHFIRAQADIYQQWAAAEDKPYYAERAFTYAQAALSDYEKSYREFREESVLNKNLALGDRIITTALTTSISRASASDGTAYHDAVLRAMELGKTILLTRELVAAAQAILDDRHATTSDSLRHLETEITLLKEAFNRTASIPYSDLLRFDRLVAEAARIRYELDRATDSAVYPVELSTAVPSVSDIRRDLTTDQAVIQYSETATDFYALYIDVDTSLVFPLPREQTLTLADSLYGLLSSGDRCSPAQYAALAYPLYEKLLGPARQALSRRAELLVIPSASLSELPFAALVVANDSLPREDDRSLPYLINSHRIRYLASWRSEQQRATLRRALKSPGPPVAGVWTHPDLKEYLTDLADLLISRAGSGSIHYADGDCSSQTLLEDGDRYDLLHLSVHARGQTGSMNANYLYLNAGDSLNGIYIGQQILPAQLVVLAACSTARGYTNRLEGTYSLRRSFHRAGVPDVISSVYDIPAAATAELFTTFYLSLFSGNTPAYALAEAQRGCIAGSMGPRNRWPGNWAGVVVG